MNKFIQIEEMNQYKTLQFIRVLKSLDDDRKYKKPPPAASPDKHQPITGDFEKLRRKKMKLPSINRNFFDPREIEEIRGSSRGSEPCIDDNILNPVDKDLDPETEIYYKKSRTANQLANIRKSPTTIQSLNILDLNKATILMRRGQGI